MTSFRLTRMRIPPSRRLTKWTACSRNKCAGAGITAGVIGTAAGAAAVIGVGAAGTGAGIAATGVGAAGIGAGIAVAGIVAIGKAPATAIARRIKAPRERGFRTTRSCSDRAAASIGPDEAVRADAAGGSHHDDRRSNHDRGRPD